MQGGQWPKVRGRGRRKRSERGGEKKGGGEGGGVGEGEGGRERKKEQEHGQARIGNGQSALLSSLTTIPDFSCQKGI